MGFNCKPVEPNIACELVGFPCGIFCKPLVDKTVLPQSDAGCCALVRGVVVAKVEVLDCGAALADFDFTTKNATSPPEHTRTAVAAAMAHNTRRENMEIRTPVLVLCGSVDFQLVLRPANKDGQFDYEECKQCIPHIIIQVF